MRTQPQSVISMHDAALESTKSVGSILSPSASPISSSESGITLNRQKLSPTSKCTIWKQRNEVNKCPKVCCECNQEHKLSPLNKVY